MDKAEDNAQHKAIKTQLQNVTAAVNRYLVAFEENSLSKDLALVGRLSQSHVSMIENVKQLQSAIYGPLNMVLLHYEEASDQH